MILKHTRARFGVGEQFYAVFLIYFDSNYCPGRVTCTDQNVNDEMYIILR